MEIERAWSDLEILRSSPPVNSAREFSEYFCSECGGVKNLDEDLPTCITCGRVDAFFVSDEPEWRSGGDDGPDPSRVGAPVNTDLFSEAWGRTTVMRVAYSASYTQKRLARINQHASMNHRDRALFHAYAEMDHIGKSILKLSENVIYAAKTKYRKFNEAVLTRGAVRHGIKANCIFQACREFSVSRTTQEIADAFGIPSRDISRTFELFQENIPETAVHVTTASDLIGRFFNALTGIPEAERGRLKMRVIKKCKELEDNVDLMGRTPKAVACAVMSIVLKGIQGAPDRATLCKICDISLPTLAKLETILKK
jgi:transcription initiation factor TFIIIB Brf1 subunit/transcription initiation factor TFIIB